MEELGLSHILNAEGEKLQYILGTCPVSAALPPQSATCWAANESVRSMLETAAQNQLFLKAKMQGALTASPMQSNRRHRANRSYRACWRYRCNRSNWACWSCYRRTCRRRYSFQQ